MKFLIIGDLHGQQPKIIKKDLVDVDAIIAPGDFCSDAPRKYMFAAMKKNMENSSSKRIEWYDLVGRKKAKVMIKKSLNDGRVILEFLDSLNIPVFVLPGNWDWTKSDRKYSWSYHEKDYWKSFLIKGLKNIHDCHKLKRVFKGHVFIGHGISSGPENPTKDSIRKSSKKEIIKKKKKYKKLLSQMNEKFNNEKRPIILLTHNVPYNTKLDKINNPKSPANGKHYGSTLARDLILKNSPLLCIGGHMHENFGKTRLGKTLCINSGFGRYVKTFAIIKEGKIVKTEFFEKGKLQ